jgi:uncharacterized protein (DUF952 family)
LIYHITKRTDWEKARALRAYMADTLASQGFIHCSNSDQVLRVANSFYKGQTGLVLLCIEEERVKAPIKRENLEGGQELFPHIYGPLNVDAVMRVKDLPLSSNGLFQPPEGF